MWRLKAQKAEIEMGDRMTVRENIWFGLILPIVCEVVGHKPLCHNVVEDDNWNQVIGEVCYCLRCTVEISDTTPPKGTTHVKSARPELLRKAHGNSQRKEDET